MNWIVTGFQARSHFRIAYDLLARFQVDSCIIVYDDVQMPVPSGTKACFLRHNTIMEYANYSVNWNTIHPLDEQILKKLVDCETMVLKMMERLAGNQEFAAYDSRKMTYLKHVRYWNHVFETTKVDLVIFDNIPHEIYDYVIYCLCKLNNVKYIILFQALGDNVLFIDSIEDPSSALKSTYDELLNEYADVPEPEISLPERADFLFQQAGKQGQGSCPLLHEKSPSIQKKGDSTPFMGNIYSSAQEKPRSA